MAELEASEGASARRLDGEGGAEASGGGQLVGAEAPDGGSRWRLLRASLDDAGAPSPEADRDDDADPVAAARRRLFRRVARAGSELAPRRRADDALDPLARTGAMRAAMIAAQAAARAASSARSDFGYAAAHDRREDLRVRDADASAASSSSPSRAAARALRRRAGLDAAASAARALVASASAASAARSFAKRSRSAATSASTLSRSAATRSRSF